MLPLMPLFEITSRDVEEVEKEVEKKVANMWGKR
jgi:hypothetical protein